MAHTAFDQVQKEIALMKKLNHPRLVTLYEVIDDESNDKLFMVIELVKGGQVMDWLGNEAQRYQAHSILKGNSVEGGGTRMTEASAKLVVRDVTRGLRYLHEQGVIHRDLKPENILIGSDGRAKIADFGGKLTGAG